VEQLTRELATKLGLKQEGWYCDFK